MYYSIDDAYYAAQTLGVKFDKFSIEEFTDGINIELEHGLVDKSTNVTDNDLIKTAKIALAHLNEYPNYYNFESDYNNVGDEGGVSFRNGKKPEALLCFLINLFSKKDDIILDFHLGSGTTAAVAHKIGRHYIGIEQMDYIKTLACERLKKVIEGEQGGISQSVNWQGGGSFVYCELAAANQTFVDEIFAAETTDELNKIWERMQQTGFLSWKVELKQFEENAKAFEELSLDDQKLFLVECLDKNLLYIPLSEVDNDEFGLDSRDRELTRKFYAM